MNLPGTTPTFLPVYPIEALPVVLRNAVQEVAARFGVTHDAVALTMLAVVSAAMLGRVKVRQPYGRVTNVETFACWAKGSGDRGTAMLDHVAEPLREYDAQATRRHEETVARYAVECDTWSTINDGLRRKLAMAVKKGQPLNLIENEIVAHALLKPKKPRSRRLNCVDTSKRGFIEKLAGTEQCATILADEGSSVLNSNLFEENSMLNKAWDGGELSLDRAHGVNITAWRPHVTLLIMVQEEVLLDYFKRYGLIARGSGLFARILWTQPMSLRGFRVSASLEPIPTVYTNKFHDRIRELLQAEHDETERIRNEIIYEFDTDAAARWRYYSNVIEAALRPGASLAEVPDLAAKVMDNTSRIAALMHHYAGLDGPISSEILGNAYTIAWYYFEEAKRIFSTDPKQKQLDSDARRLENYLHGQVIAGESSLPRTSIYRCGPIRNDLPRFRDALEVLKINRVVTIDTPRNKTAMVYMNLAHFQTLAARA